MLVSKGTEFGTFGGEDGVRLTLRLLATPPSDNGWDVEVSLECDDCCFRAVLDRSETARLHSFLGFSYRDAERGFLAFSGGQGERITFRHSNMGEPYREGVVVQVKGLDAFPDYLDPFIESSEIRRMRDFITQYHSKGVRSSMKPDQSENIALMANMFREQKEARKPSLFVIQGASASGKSLFGRALAEDGAGAAYVDFQSSDGIDTVRPHLRDHLSLSATTIVVDGAHCANPETLAETVEQELNKGNTIVLLVPMLIDIPKDLLSQAAVARMDRLALTPIRGSRESWSSSR